MLFNKLQGREGIADIQSIPPEEFRRIDDDLFLKAIRNVADINLTDIDKIKE